MTLRATPQHRGQGIHLILLWCGETIRRVLSHTPLVRIYRCSLFALAVARAEYLMCVFAIAHTIISQAHCIRLLMLARFARSPWLAPARQDSYNLFFYFIVFLSLYMRILI